MKTRTGFGLVLTTFLGGLLSAIPFVSAQNTDPKEGTPQAKPAAPYVDANFRKALSSSKLSLTQAILAAETQTKGKSFKATLKMGPPIPASDSMNSGSESSLSAEIWIATPEKVFSVMVDQNGKVVPSMEKDKGESGKQ